MECPACGHACPDGEATCDCGQKVPVGPARAKRYASRTRPKPRWAAWLVYAALLFAALGPIVTLVFWLTRPHSSPLSHAFAVSGAFTVLALVVLVVVGRRGARALASLTAFLAWLLSLPSVLTVAAVLTAKYGWFGITEESLVDGEARFLVDWILVVLTTFPLLLIFSPLPALVLYFVVRRAGEL